MSFTCHLVSTRIILRTSLIRIVECPRSFLGTQIWNHGVSGWFLLRDLCREPRFIIGRQEEEVNRSRRDRRSGSA